MRIRTIRGSTARGRWLAQPDGEREVGIQTARGGDGPASSQRVVGGARGRWRAGAGRGGGGCIAASSCRRTTLTLLLAERALSSLRLSLRGRSHHPPLPSASPFALPYTRIARPHLKLNS